MYQICHHHLSDTHYLSHLTSLCIRHTLHFRHSIPATIYTLSSRAPTHRYIHAFLSLFTHCTHTTSHTHFSNSLGLHTRYTHSSHTTHTLHTRSIGRAHSKGKNAENHTVGGGGRRLPPWASSPGEASFLGHTQLRTHDTHARTHARTHDTKRKRKAKTKKLPGSGGVIHIYTHHTPPNLRFTH